MCIGGCAFQFACCHIHAYERVVDCTCDGWDGGCCVHVVFLLTLVLAVFLLTAAALICLAAAVMIVAVVLLAAVLTITAAALIIAAARVVAAAACVLDLGMLWWGGLSSLLSICMGVAK